MFFIPTSSFNKYEANCFGHKQKVPNNKLVDTAASVSVYCIPESISIRLLLGLFKCILLLLSQRNYSLYVWQTQNRTNSI